MLSLSIPFRYNFVIVSRVASLTCKCCFSTELIYKEVMDWEERNKNGVLKEEGSG